MYLSPKSWSVRRIRPSNCGPLHLQGLHACERRIVVIAHRREHADGVRLSEPRFPPGRFTHGRLPCSLSVSAALWGSPFARYRRGAGQASTSGSGPRAKKSAAPAPHGRAISARHGGSHAPELDLQCRSSFHTSDFESEGAVPELALQVLELAASEHELALQALELAASERELALQALVLAASERELALQILNLLCGFRICSHGTRTCSQFSPPHAPEALSLASARSPPGFRKHRSPRHTADRLPLQQRSACLAFART